LYQLFLLNSYIPNFKKYSNQNIKINQITKQDDGYLVSTRIERPEGEAVKISYLVKNNKICDIIVEGVSLIAVQRSDFSTILSQSGVDGLINKLDAKLH
jgi:phospholipid transport system substrate-binding protein